MASSDDEDQAKPELGKIYVFHRLKSYTSSALFARCESFTKSGNPKMRVFKTHFERVTPMGKGIQDIDYILSIAKDEDGEYITMEQDTTDWIRECKVHKIYHSVIARLRKDGSKRFWTMTLSPGDQYYNYEEWDEVNIYRHTSYS